MLCACCVVKRRKLERQAGLTPQMREQAGMRYEDLLLRHINLSTSLSSQMRELAALQYEDLCLRHIQLSRRLCWHERLRDWVSATGQAACLQAARAGMWPAWVCLDAAFLHTL
eukprot:s831_g12.t1